MARRANYGFEKRQKEIKKQQKRDAKAEKKQLKKEEETATGDVGTDVPASDETNVDSED